MKFVKSLCLVSVFGLLPAMPVLAHGDLNADRFERRIDRQDMRIANGVRSGELTRHERKQLRKQHRRIKRLLREFLSDGRLNHRERHTMERRLDKASNTIRRLKHNDRYRYSKRGWKGKGHHARHDRTYLYKGDGLTVYYDSRGHGRGRW